MNEEFKIVRDLSNEMQLFKQPNSDDSRPIGGGMGFAGGSPVVSDPDVWAPPPPLKEEKVVRKPSLPKQPAPAW